MKTTRVIRYENEQGQGPYTKGAMFMLANDTDRQVLPQRDPEFRKHLQKNRTGGPYRAVNSGGKFAFSNSAQMNAYLSPENQGHLQTHGYHPTVYEVPERSVRRGTHQVQITPNASSILGDPKNRMRKMPTPKITVEE